MFARLGTGHHSRSATATPISRLGVKVQIYLSLGCSGDGIFITTATQRNSFLCLPCCMPTRNRIRFLSAGCELNRTGHSSRSSVPRSGSRPPWQLLPPQRNVGARRCPMGLRRTVAVAFATPVNCGSSPGRPSHRQQSAAQRKRPFRTMAFHQSQYWLVSFAPNLYAKQRATSNGFCSRNM